MSIEQRNALFLANPPVIEAVAGLEFLARAVDFTDLVKEATAWEKEFPRSAVRNGLPPAERLSRATPGEEFQWLGTTPPLRLWSSSDDDQWIVQTQDDRVVLNWREVNGQFEYPGYNDGVRPRISELLSVVAAKGDLTPTVAEYTYVNHVGSSVADWHDVYTPFSKLETGSVGQVVAAKYELVTEHPCVSGVAQVTASMRPSDSKDVSVLIISGRVFPTGDTATVDPLQMIDDAHDASLGMFRAVVSSQAMKLMEGRE